MMELYLHLPFCRQKCRYCDFASWSGQDHRIPDYVNQVIREAQQRAQTLGDQAVDTVFVGGGTPSVLPPSMMTTLLEGVFRFFPPKPNAEFTIEANPGTLTREWLDTIRKLGCNRLSMGLQAAQPRLLKTLGRIHTAEDAALSVRMARAAGFENLSLDLIFGIPGQTREMWRESLDFALSLSPEHLSCYGLIPEEGTPLKADLDAGRLTLPDEEDERAMYDDALSVLANAGYGQYEISNFAKPGRECRHNIGYWTREPYLGLGLAAASCFLTSSGSCVRETNPSNWDDYALVVNQKAPREQEIVSPEDAQFETLMLGLRMTKGVDEKTYEATFGESISVRYGSRLENLQQRGLLEHENGFWRLTRRGMDIQNSVLVELME